MCLKTAGSLERYSSNTPFAPEHDIELCTLISGRESRYRAEVSESARFLSPESTLGYEAGAFSVAAPLGMESLSASRSMPMDSLASAGSATEPKVVQFPSLRMEIQ